jgi:tetratricopeptide (TPR) repeat protein
MKIVLRFCVFPVAFIIALILTTTVAGAERGTAPQTIAGLGTATFPTSAKSDAAQTAFMRGLLLLHLFEYATAAEAFEQAEKLQPDFAMAYWGEAMTYNHGIWNQLDADAGRAALAKLGPTSAARVAKAPTAREKAWLATVEILYSGNDTKPERDARYCDAMKELAAKYSHDNNAQLFYALALMGRNEGVRNEKDYLPAAAIAKRSFRINPQNPGAAHYWIHGMDDPAHAASALEAARALSKIAPDAGHAQHMTSHIFIALGMWDDVVNANINAMRVVDAQRHAEGKPAVECGHYDEWLEYGYFQQGRYHQAQRTLEACASTIPPEIEWAKQHAQMLQAQHSSPEQAARYLHGSLVTMRGTALVESRDWSGAAATLAVDAVELGPYAAWNDFAVGYAAAECGDMAKAQQSSADLHMWREKTPTSEADPQLPGYLAVMDDSLRGIVLIHQQHADDGMQAIRRAARRYDAMAFDFGPPVPLKPPHELLGEQLLQSGKAGQAVAEFQAVLEKAPNRSLSLLGLARAQAAAHDAKAAAATCRKLLAIWHAADADLPALAEARAFLAH